MLTVEYVESQALVNLHVYNGPGRVARGWSWAHTVWKSDVHVPGRVCLLTRGNTGTLIWQNPTLITDKLWEVCVLVVAKNSFDFLNYFSGLFLFQCSVPFFFF